MNFCYFNYEFALFYLVFYFVFCHFFLCNQVRCVFELVFSYN